jgi:hypothetical protein
MNELVKYRMSRFCSECVAWAGHDDSWFSFTSQDLGAAPAQKVKAKLSPIHTTACQAGRGFVHKERSLPCTLVYSVARVAEMSKSFLGEIATKSIV